MLFRSGQFEYPAFAPSAPFLADQIIGWHGIEDGDSFRRTAIPVLERSIAKQYHTFPQTKAAIKASRTRLVPGTGTRTNGYKFFTAPEAGDYMENMFDKRYPITQFEPQHFSQEPGGDILMPEEEAPIPDSVLDSILNSQEPGAQEEFDLNDLLNQPYDGEGDALSKTMNRNRSGLLHGLYA